MTTMGQATRTLPSHTLWPTIVSPGAHVSAMTGSLAPLCTSIILAHCPRVLRTRLRGNARVGSPVHRERGDAQGSRHPQRWSGLHTRAMFGPHAVHTPRGYETRGEGSTGPGSRLRGLCCVEDITDFSHLLMAIPH